MKLLKELTHGDAGFALMLIVMAMTMESWWDSETDLMKVRLKAP